jgi:MoaA/NifB/PqqE/SkfB family radical SAM enzyme
MFKTNRDSKTKYGFYGRLKAEFPSQLNVDITEICNLACVHCLHSEFRVSEHYSGSSLEPELNAKLVDEVRQHGRNYTQYIRYSSNGEPLTHKFVFEMIEYAVRNSGVIVTLTTNGTIMNDKRIERLLATGVDVVDISIDAFSAETYAKIRIGGNLHVTRANVLNLIAMSKQSSSKTKVVVSYIEQPLNMHEAKDFEKYWKDNGADYVVIRRFHSCSGAKAELAEESRKINKQEPRRPCLYPWERMVLNARGELVFCPSDWVHGSVIANYRNTSIHEIWHSEFYQKLREAHLRNDFTNYTFCEQCPDWASTRWPQEGRSYANMIEEFKEPG